MHTTQLYSTGQAAKMLNVSASYVRQLARTSGVDASHRTEGGQRRFTDEDIQKLRSVLGGARPVACEEAAPDQVQQAEGPQGQTCMRCAGTGSSYRCADQCELCLGSGRILIRRRTVQQSDWRPSEVRSLAWHALGTMGFAMGFYAFAFATRIPSAGFTKFVVAVGMLATLVYMGMAAWVTMQRRPAAQFVTEAASTRFQSPIPAGAWQEISRQ